MKVFIEQPVQENKKNVFDKKTGLFLKTVPIKLTYPFPYGYILNTLAEDGDNLDCYIITNKGLETGSVVECEAIGMAEWFEDGEEDHKILAVLSDETEDITEEVKSKITYFAQHFFDDQPEKKYRMGEFYGKAEALDLIQKARHQTIFTDNQKQVLELLATTFKENNIDYQATGGLATIAYGATRPLYDIDIDIYKKDVAKVRSLFSKHIVEDWNNELEGDNDNFDLWMMTLEIDGVSIDISQLEESRVRKIGGGWVDQPETMDVETRTVAGIELPIQNKQHLIEYKLLIARDTDLEDVSQMR